MSAWCRKVLTPSVTVFFHFLFARADGEKANTFFAKLGEGADLPSDSPIYVLRERLLRAQLDDEALLPVEQYALIILAWNAFYRGKRMRRLTWRRDKDFPLVAGLSEPD